MRASKFFRSASLAAVCLVASFAHAATRPNFIFIVTDDQRYDALGVVQQEQKGRGRFPWLETPHLDRIAQEGVRFRNAFVTLSLCAPSRSAFLTGRYNHENRVVDNQTDFPATNRSYAGLLQDAGYATAFFGKFHHDGQKGNRPGFAHSASFIGQGVFQNCTFEVNGEMVATKGWVDDVSTDMAIDYIKTNRSKPLCLFIGYKSCHGPTVPPERAAKRFEGVEARAVPNLTNLAPFRTAAEVQARKQATGTVPINVNYFRCLSAIDDNVGRILQLLDTEKLAENTVVVFASDNGYYMGEHGLGDKRSAYEESIRIPLLLRYPKMVKPGVNDRMVLNIDLAPTFLELAGVPIPADIQGRSWVPLLKGREEPWRTSFLLEYFLETRFPNTPTLVAVRTENAKLVEYPGHAEWTELFDLSHDPYEQDNLVSKNRGLLKTMKQEMERQKLVVAYKTPDTADKAEFSASAPQKKKGKRKKKQD